MIMANPGSPQAMQQSRGANPMPTMQKGTMIGMFAVLIIMLVVMMYRAQIGQILNYGLEPLLGFGGQMPVLTLIVAGLLMITLSTVIRTLLTDSVAQARNQKISSDFSKEMRQARLENNLYKLKKLQEEQPKMTAKSMESSTQMMKLMPVTMVVVIPIYAWIGYFLGDPYYMIDGMQVESIVPVELLTINIPWGEADLVGRVMGMLPTWIIIYTMISLPIGQLESRAIRFFLLRKRLAELDGIEQK